MQSKKTIVIVIPHLRVWGVGRVMLDLATALQQNNCNVHIVVLQEIIELAYSGNIQLHVFKQNLRWIPKSLRGLVLDRFIMQRCGQPDLVLANAWAVSRLLTHSKFNTTFVIHTTMGHDYNYGKNFKTKSMKKIYTKQPIVCVSKGVQNNFIKLFKPSKKVQTIYNPIDIQFIQQMARGGGTDSTNLNDYIVHVGRFSPEKRHDILIKAYKQSNIKNPLVLIGDGPIKNDIKALVHKLNLDNKVIFLGFQSNPYPLIKKAKLLVLCSDIEGLGMVILEALALNTAVISTDCPSGPCEILPAKNLCPVGDVEKLAQLMKQASDDPLAFTHPLDEKFHLSTVVKQYMDLI